MGILDSVKSLDVINSILYWDLGPYLLSVN